MVDNILNIQDIDFEDIYFTPNYYRIFEKNEEGKFEYFHFKEKEKIAYYPFLKNYISNTRNLNPTGYYDIQGAYGYNGVISNSKSQAFIDNFYNEFNNFCKKNNIIAEFTRFHPLINNYDFSKSHMDISLNRETVSIGLQLDYMDIWKYEYSSNNRNMIRKARKLGYKIDIISQPTISDINVFFNIYISTMKKIKADKYYFFSKDFFNYTFQKLKNNSCLINVINTKGEIICSSIFLKYKNFFHYHLSGRSDISDNSVNNFLIDQAVQYAQSINCSQLHLGGGTTNSPNDSLLKFKSNFSKKKLPFYIGKKIHNPEVYNQLINEWGNANPNKKEKYKHVFLKYRF